MFSVIGSKLKEVYLWCPQLIDTNRSTSSFLYRPISSANEANESFNAPFFFCPINSFTSKGFSSFLSNSYFKRNCTRLPSAARPTAELKWLLRRITIQSLSFRTRYKNRGRNWQARICHNRWLCQPDPSRALWLRSRFIHSSSKRKNICLRTSWRFWPCHWSLRSIGTISTETIFLRPFSRSK